MLKSIPISISKHYFKSKIRVLFYHRVNNDFDWFGMSVDAFEQQIEYLVKNYSVISLTDYLSIIDNKKTSRNAILLTFDDGYHDNYIHAYKVLKKYSVPATIFLTTDFIDRKLWMWHDIFRYIFRTTRIRNPSLTFGARAYKFNLDDNEQLICARRGVYDEIKDLQYDERLDRLQALARALQVEVPKLPTTEYQPLHWDEIREMSENNIEFGAHTCTHEILSKITGEHSREELYRSKKRIEAELGTEILAFAYPNGQNEDFTPENRSQLIECGYKIAFTTISGLNSKSTDRYLQNRLSAGNSFGNVFKANVSGVTTMKNRILNILPPSR